VSFPEAVAFGAWCFAVALAGGLVGLVLGNIRLPAVLLLAASPGSAGGANIAISGVTAATASVAHIRAGRVSWRLFAWMAPPSVVGALVGGYLAGVVPDDAVLLGIAVVLVYSGIDLLRRPPRRRPAAEGEAGTNIAAVVLSGAVIGLLGGFVGLILGTLRVPALLRFTGEPAARTVGTNLLVGVCVGIAGLIGHLPSAAPDLGIVLIGSAASIPGALLGARLTGRLSEEQLLRAIGVVLLVAGVAAAAQALA
jgi:uncharacterized membrane protein YfcA